MNAADPGWVLRAMVEMFSAGDLSALHDVVALGYVDHQGLDGVEVHGPEGFRRVVDAARGDTMDLNIVVEDLVVTDDRAIARLRWHGGPSDGQPVERETIEIVRVESGKAVEHWGVAGS